LIIFSNTKLFAEEYDCVIFDSEVILGDTYEDLIDEKVEKISVRISDTDILDKKDYKLAFQNLYAACCSLRGPNIKCTFEDEKREIFPNSPYLSDQLLDI
jgi:hypothetical protein